MQVERLDHVALWVADRKRLSGFLTGGFGMHVIDETDRFTLVGADARRGKLTLFAADGPRDAGQLEAIGLRVGSLDRALEKLATAIESRTDGRATVRGPEGLALTLVEAPTDLDYDLDHVSLGVHDAVAASVGLARLGLDTDADGRLSAGGTFVDLVETAPRATDRPLLNHLGLLVNSADEHLEEARRLGVEIAEIVDAANTYAVFVWGPERLKLEYVEHKPTFALR